MFSGLKKTGITQNTNNGNRKRDRYQEVWIDDFLSELFFELIIIYLHFFIVISWIPKNSAKDKQTKCSESK